MNNPRVYVGTYGKYNRGSLAGGWVSLNECKDYEAFLRKCRALHRGEHDPEYMIQDSEDFPDGLDCMEWLSEQDFNDVKQAISEQQQDEQTADDGATLAEQLRLALLMATGEKAMAGRKPSAKTARQDDKALLEEYMQEWTKVWQDKGMLDYERKKFNGAVRLANGGILFFEKPSIDNRFCFHDEGPQYDFYCHLMADKEKRLAEYFKQENLGKMDGDIESLREAKLDERDGFLYDSDHRRVYLQRLQYDGQAAPLNLWRYLRLRPWDVEDRPSFWPNIEPMTEGDRKTILAGLQREREKFEKRLDSYLKRYGVSKIHTWTYWADA